MSKRPRSRPGGAADAAGRGLRREAFPAIRAFARGYLHEDFPEVHGSIRQAAAAFRDDASADERERLVDELERLAEILASKPARLLRQFIVEDLGSGWAPKSREELLELLGALRER
jgi:hypothetical protein